MWDCFKGYWYSLVEKKGLGKKKKTHLSIHKLTQTVYYYLHSCFLPFFLLSFLSFFPSLFLLLAFLFFFPLEAADADGHFVDITGCKNTNQGTFEKTPATQYTEEYWLFTLEVIWLTESCLHPFLTKALKSECRGNAPEYISCHTLQGQD